MKNEKKGFELIIILFRKIITSLSCIEHVTDNKDIKDSVGNYLTDFIKQYNDFCLHHDAAKISFNYSEMEIVDFCNECYDKVEIFTFAEDLEFGFKSLVEEIMSERTR